MHPVFDDAAVGYIGDGVPARPVVSGRYIVIYLGKGSKKKLIIFAKFSAKGGGYPLFVKIINFFSH